MPKDYPAFIIDRSRRSEASRFTDDFIVCTDKEVGFIARVYKVPKSRRAEVAARMDDPANENRYLAVVAGDAVAVMEIVKMLHEPVAHWSRLRPLMKKALKAYVHGEVEAVRRDGLPYDDQIAALDDVVGMVESQYPRLVDLNGETGASAFLRALRSARESVKLLQKITRHE